jgi:hypothetical protein
MCNFKLKLSIGQATFIKLAWLSFLVIYFYSTLWGASLYGVGYMCYLLESLKINSKILYPIISYLLSFIGLYMIFKKKVSTFLTLILQDLILVIPAFHFAFQLTTDLDIGMDSFESVYISLFPMAFIVIALISFNDYLKTSLIRP